MTSHAAHFEDLGQQADASELATWIIITSELLLFAGLFGLYTASRAGSPLAFDEGVHHMSRPLGTINLFILLTSSLTAALADAALHARRRALAATLLGVTILLGCVFLLVKGIEYGQHLHEGIAPGFVREHVPRPTVLFITLYYLMTGLHALHVFGGIVILSWIAARIVTGTVTPTHSHPLRNATLYWHFVDMVWLFLWPAFYLTGGG